MSISKISCAKLIEENIQCRIHLPIFQWPSFLHDKNLSAHPTIKYSFLILFDAVMHGALHAWLHQKGSVILQLPSFHFLPSFTLRFSSCCINIFPATGIEPMGLFWWPSSLPLDDQYFINSIQLYVPFKDGNLTKIK